MISLALQKIRPGAIWGLNGNTYEGLEWHDTMQSKPTKDEIDLAIIEVKKEIELTQYQRLRKAEYDKLNQFELQFDDATNGTTTWADAINAIKAKYPKPQ